MGAGKSGAGVGLRPVEESELVEDVCPQEEVDHAPDGERQTGRREEVPVALGQLPGGAAADGGDVGSAFIVIIARYVASTRAFTGVPAVCSSTRSLPVVPTSTLIG